jgi:hypothetical protein
LPGTHMHRLFVPCLIYHYLNTNWWPCHSSGGQSPASHRGGPGHVGFVVDKVALGQVFSKHFGFPYQSFHWLLHAYHPSSGAGTIGQIVVVILNKLSPTPHPPQETKKGGGGGIGHSDLGLMNVASL